MSMYSTLRKVSILYLLLYPGTHNSTSSSQGQFLMRGCVSIYVLNHELFTTFSHHSFWLGFPNPPSQTLSLANTYIFIYDMLFNMPFSNVVAKLQSCCLPSTLIWWPNSSVSNIHTAHGWLLSLLCIYKWPIGTRIQIFFMLPLNPLNNHILILNFPIFSQNNSGPAGGRNQPD